MRTFGEIADDLRRFTSEAEAAGMSLGLLEKIVRETFMGEAVLRHGGNQTATAEALGVHRNTIWRAMRGRCRVKPQNRRQRR